MPVDLTSRYWGLPSYTVVEDERTSTALPARPLPPASGDNPYKHRVTGVETLEYLAWRYFGNSAAWWHIADANGLVFPLDQRPGATVLVPPVGDIGRIRRTRSF